ESVYHAEQLHARGSGQNIRHMIDENRVVVPGRLVGAVVRVVCVPLLLVGIEPEPAAVVENPPTDQLALEQHPSSLPQGLPVCRTAEFLEEHVPGAATLRLHLRHHYDLPRWPPLLLLQDDPSPRRPGAASPDRLESL